MARNTLIYAWSVIAAGTAVAASAVLLWQPKDIAAFAVCLGLALLASTFKVKLPTADGTISPGFVFLLVAIGMLGWSETVAIGVASALVQCLWRRNTRPDALQVCFNAAAMAVAGGLTYGVAHGLAQSASEPMLFLAVAGVVLLVTNTLLVAAIVCLIKNAPLYTVWRLLQPRVIPYYLAGGVLAGVWSRADLTTSAGVAVMAAVSAYLLSLWQREQSALQPAS
jgi:hypothetical protein